MADHEGKDLSRTLLGGSEEDYRIVCDPCHFENQHIEAKGYCTSCNENLCDVCIKVHRKMSLLRTHVIETSVRSQSTRGRGKMTMPPVIDKDPLTDRCEEHQHEVVKFFCNTHQTLGCGVCIPMDHKMCTDVLYIRDVSDGITNSDELTTVQSGLRQLAALLRFKRSWTERTKKNVKERYSKTLEEIDSFQEEIITYVKEMAGDARQEAKRLKEESLKESDEQLDACEELVKETEQLTNDVETRTKSCLNNGLYVAVKRANSKLPTLKQKTDNISSSSKNRLVFKRDETFTELIKSRVQIGNLSMTGTPLIAEHVQDLDITSGEDTNKCLIQGITVVSDGRLVVTDVHNKAVKVIDIHQRKVIDRTSTSSKPIDITAIGDAEVAITLTGEHVIQVFSLKPKLTMSRAINVQHLYGGIAYTPERFVLRLQLVEKDSAIHICDTSGKLMLSIETPMKSPLYVSLSPDQENIYMYVSDDSSNTVFSFDISGEIIRTLTHIEIKGPRGIAVADDGCVYICSAKTNTVYQVNSGSSIAVPILTNKQGLDYPMALVCREDTLYISSSSSVPKHHNVIKVFKLC